MWIRISEIRTGEISMIAQSGILSGIAKAPRPDAVEVTVTGLAGDRQAESFHGGADKAVLHYDSAHYAAWTQDFPHLAHRFVPGGFGENIVAAGFSEASVCIGDVVRAGTALLQVSEPRQPCFKLNHRFGDPGIARRAQETGRTGWLYRVIETGTLREGDRMEVIDRPLPAWSVARLQSYLYDLIDDIDRAAELADLPHLSQGFRALFARRVAEGRTEDWSARLSNGPLVQRKPGWFEAVLQSVDVLSADVRAYTLRRADGRDLSPAEPGAHLEVKVENALTRAYSLIPAPPGLWRIAVRRDAAGRGGSRAIHAGWTPGMPVIVSQPRSHFPLRDSALRHEFLAAGIGITAFLGMIEACEATGADWHLTWLMRSADDLPFVDLPARHRGRVTLHLSQGQAERRFDPARDLPCQAAGLHLYCCGPSSLMRAVAQATADWLPGHVHFESFAPAVDLADRPFLATVEGHAETISVGAAETLLAALRRSGFAVASDCEVGNCGACVVDLRAGEVEHRDVCLSPAARSGRMAACVSRGVGPIVVATLPRATS